MEQFTELSKFLSYVLRHRPESIGVSMDAAGWVDIEELIGKSNAAGHAMDRNRVETIVKTDAKGRYSISEDGRRIRANQGHSIAVDLDFKEAVPPATLFHGTYQGVIDLILKKGLKRMQRHHVHLSADREKAIQVGARRGYPVVLEIDAAQMVKDGIKFFIAENGVWLTDEVPARYLRVMK